MKKDYCLELAQNVIIGQITEQIIKYNDLLNLVKKTKSRQELLKICKNPFIKGCQK